MSTRPAITMTPGVCGGRPCIAGTRLATEVVAGRIEAGETIRDVARDFEITESQVAAAVEFEREHEQ